jgi:hypothetical protein
MGPTISGDYPCIGKVVGGSSNGGWTIAFDDLPEAEKQVTINRNKVVLLEEGEYDVELPPQLTDMIDYHDHGDDDEEDLSDNDAESNNKRKRPKKKLSPEKDQSINSAHWMTTASRTSLNSSTDHGGAKDATIKLYNGKCMAKLSISPSRHCRLIPTQRSLIPDHVDFTVPPNTIFSSTCSLISQDTVRYWTGTCVIREQVTIPLTCSWDTRSMMMSLTILTGSSSDVILCLLRQ